MLRLSIELSSTPSSRLARSRDGTVSKDRIALTATNSPNTNARDRNDRNMASIFVRLLLLLLYDDDDDDEEQVSEKASRVRHFF